MRICLQSDQIRNLSEFEYILLSSAFHNYFLKDTCDAIESTLREAQN